MFFFLLANFCLVDVLNTAVMFFASFTKNVFLGAAQAGGRPHQMGQHCQTQKCQRPKPQWGKARCRNKASQKGEDQGEVSHIMGLKPDGFVFNLCLMRPAR